MKRFALILLLAIAASCSKTPLQVIPDEFVGTFRGYHFYKENSGNNNFLVQNDAIKFEIRPDGTYTGTTFYVNPSLGLVIPENGLFRITSENDGTVKVVNDIQRGGYGYKAIIAPLCFWLDATIYKPLRV